MSFLIQCDGCGTITPARPSEYRDHEHDSILGALVMIVAGSEALIDITAHRMLRRGSRRERSSHE